MLRVRPFAACKSVHHPTLDHLHIASDVDRLFAAIGWQRYLTIDYPSYSELSWEVYTTFSFDKPSNLTLSTPDVVKFRLLGVDMSLSINEFNILLGFIDPEAVSSPEYMNSACDYGQPFARDYIDIWREWSVDKFTYNPSKSKSSYLKDPVLRYIHKFLAFNFSGRKDASCILSKAEFYFLWCMVNKDRKSVV